MSAHDTAVFLGILLPLIGSILAILVGVCKLLDALDRPRRR